MERIAWGAKVSSTFLDRVKWIVEDLQIGVTVADGMSNLLTCIAWESGRTFSPSIVNKAGSGATGLIQFMPATAKALGTTTTALAKMTAEDQLNYVWKYFSAYKGKLKSLSDLYMAILWPKAVGKPETYVLWNKGEMPTTYRQNSGLDINKDGSIIKAEASAKLNAMLAEGWRDANVREYSALGLARTWSAPEPEPEPVVVPAPSSLETLVLDKADDVLDRPVPSEPKATTTKVKEAVSGWQGNLAGAALVIGGLMSDPNFAKIIGNVTTAFATGTGRTGAVMAMIGAGLLAYRARTAK